MQIQKYGIFSKSAIFIYIRTHAFAAHEILTSVIFTNNKRVGLSGRCHSLTQSAVWVLYDVTCSNRSEREESYDIITASIKYFGQTFVPYKEVGDTFVPYMEAWFPRASND